MTFPLERTSDISGLIGDWAGQQCRGFGDGIVSSKNFPSWGFGAIVIDDPNSPWVKPNDYLALVEICYNELGIHYLDSGQIYGDCEKTLGAWFSTDKGKKIQKHFQGGLKSFRKR